MLYDETYSMGYFKDGKHVGEWRHYDKDGNYTKAEYFDKGVSVGFHMTQEG